MLSVTVLWSQEIFEIIKTALENIRYNDGRGYYFIIDSKAVSLLQPSAKEFENKNLFEYEDQKGYKFMKSIVKTIEDKSERFDEYYWKNPNNSEKNSKKISFYKYFEPFNIAIGSGEYVKEFEKTIQEKALEYINLISFGKNGFIFVIDYDGVVLSHVRKDLLGKNTLTNNNLSHIKNIILDFIKISKNGEGYYSYIQDKRINSDEPMNKTSFIKGLNNWNWVMGTGFYEDDIKNIVNQKKEQLNKKFDDYIENMLMILIFLTFILLFISKYISSFLEKKFNDYKKELEEKQNILYQQTKMAAMGEMIGNIAHQWKQPLSTITTSSTGLIACKNIGILEDQMLEDSLKRITISAKYLSNTIDDFRNFFNPEKDKSEFLLTNTFKLTLDLISSQFNSQNIEIIKNIEKIQVISYENELIQVLINILNNAKDALNENKLAIKLIFINVYKDENNLVIKIKDNAGGIPKENLEKIFESYFTTKNKSEGTGIGLYMTQDIILNHLKGSISVTNKSFSYKNTSYKGAEFQIKIPSL